MAFDGLVTKCICNELNCLINGKINKIFEPNNNEIILGIYSGGKNYALDICIDSSNYRINLTTHSKPNPQNVLGFCMVLRKHLNNGTIRKIYTNGLERIVFIEIECRNELNDTICKTLVIELMGKHSNVILLNEKHIIIDSLRHLNKFDKSNRDVFPGSKYVYILSEKLDFCNIKTFDEFYSALNITEGFSIASSISKTFNGFGKNNILYLLSYIGISDNSTSSKDLKFVFTTLKALINHTKYALLKSYKNASTNKQDYFAVCSDTPVEALSSNFFIDDFYFNKENLEIFNSAKNNVLKLVLNQIDRLKEKIKNVDIKIKECSKMDLYKLYGELITANLYRINDYNQDSITLENYYDENRKMTIPLDNSISPSQNAKNFFKKYKKLQNTISVINIQKELFENEVKYLDSIVYEIENADDLSEINSVYSEVCDNLLYNSKNSNTVNNNLYDNSQSNSLSKKNTKSLTNIQPAKYKIDGYTVLVGKNNKQNDYLTCRLAQNSDIWFHTKDIHGSHVVLKNDNPSSKLDINKTNIPDSVLYKCASLAAYFSKARLSQNVPVDYTFIKYVKKPNGANLGMVIYTNNKTLYVNPDSNFKYLQ